LLNAGSILLLYRWLVNSGQSDEKDRKMGAIFALILYQKFAIQL